MVKERVTTKTEATPDYGEVFFNWKFSEFTEHQRDVNWYIWGGIVVALFLIYSFFTANLLFGFITIISSLLILMFQRSSNKVEFKITEDGILVNNKFFEYKKIENFYIIYEPPEVKTLYFELVGFFSPRIPITLDDQNPVAIRNILRQYLNEDLERENEPVSDQTSRMFKL